MVPVLNPEVQAAMLRIALRKRQEEDVRFNKIGTYFPDGGEYRRELYEKHLEFFGAGVTYKERLFMAANRCKGLYSPIQTDLGERRIGELIGGGGFDVPSWDGSSRCTKRAAPVFLKGIEKAFRVHLSNGEYFDCAPSHAVLSTHGWLPFESLLRASSGVSYCRKPQGSKANYSTEFYCDGGRPPLSRGAFGAPPPLRADVHERIQLKRPDGVVEPKSAYSHLCLKIGPLSNLDDPDQLMALCGRFEDPTSAIDDLWKPGLRQELLQFAHELVRSQLAGVYPPSEPSTDELPSGNEYRDVCKTNSIGDTKDPSARLYGFASSQLLSGAEFLGAEPHTEIFFPLKSPSLIGGVSIVSVVALGLQPILDTTVKGTHNYISEGLVHHNCGKSEAGAYESVCHATGIYPAWWVGRRFDAPTEGWACGTTGETTRDIVQVKLVGSVGQQGTGMIPRHLIEGVTSRRGGIADALESIRVRHISGKTSVIGLKSYQQGRESFEGTAKQWIWLDEEPPGDVYTECLYRTPTVKGIVYVTFTPLQGMSDVVKGFVEPETDKSNDYKWYVQAGWQDVPHIAQSEKDALIATTPPYQIDARTKGEPALGSGAIYPIPESEISVENFQVPANWPRCFAMDVGWNRTACLWMAREPGTNQIVIYDEYYQGMGEPASHAAGIRARGEWIPGVIDPAANGRSQIDGSQLLDVYRKLGLNLVKAENSVEGGIVEVWNLMVSGRLKIQKRCFNFFREFRQYHRDDKGKGNIVKKNDHLMDCFTGDTEVMTPEGAIKIADLIGERGRIISRNGSVAEFCGAALIRKNSKVVRLTFTDGSEVTCTPEHLFLTSDGWVQAIDLKGTSCYNGVSQWISRTSFGSNLRSLFLRPFRGFSTAIGTFAGSISNAGQSDCMFGFGKLQTAGASLRDTTSTTKITTDQITGLEILNFSKSPTISGITNSATKGHPPSKPLMLLRSGIAAKPAGSGILSTTLKTVTPCTENLNSHVGNAEPDSQHKPKVKINSAQTPANPSFVEYLVLTIRNVLAWSVATLSLSIAIPKQKRAQSSALLGCVEIQNAGFQDVYCLTVPGSQAFCLANGAVVHNCCRYGCVSGRPIMRLKPVIERPYQERPVIDTNGRGWMV